MGDWNHYQKGGIRELGKIQSCYGCTKWLVGIVCWHDIPFNWLSGGVRNGTMERARGHTARTHSGGSDQRLMTHFTSARATWEPLEKRQCHYTYYYTRNCILTITKVHARSHNINYLKSFISLCANSSPPPRIHIAKAVASSRLFSRLLSFTLARFIHIAHTWCLACGGGDGA